MASSRFFDEAPADTHVRAFVDRLRASARLDGLISKLSFLTQPQEISGALLNRVVQSDPLFGPALMRKLATFAGDTREPIEVLGAEEARRVLACTAMSVFLAVAAPKFPDAAAMVVKSTYAISYIAGRLGEGAKYSSAESCAGLACAHAFGLVSMIATYEDEYADIVTRLDQNLFDWELATFGVTHCEAGALLMNRFGFSLTQTEAIGMHHLPISDIKEFPQLIAISESIACGADLGIGAPSFDPDRIKPWILRLGAKPESVADWAANIRSQTEKLA